MNEIIKQNEKNKSCIKSKKLSSMIFKLKKKCENRKFFEMSKNFKFCTQHLIHKSKSFYNNNIVENVEKLIKIFYEKHF